MKHEWIVRSFPEAERDRRGSSLSSYASRAVDLVWTERHRQSF